MNRCVGRLVELDVGLTQLRSGRGLLVTGAVGIGKSTLIHELRAAFAKESGMTMLLSCSSRESESPLGVFAPYLDRSDAASPAIPLQMTQAVAQVRSRVLEQGTSAIFVDDAHLLDATSASVLHGLALTGILLVAGLRSGEEIPAPFRTLLREQRLEALEVGGLSVEETHRFASDRLEGDVASSAVTLLHSATGGNPLQLLEVIRENRETGALQQRHGIWTLRRALASAPTVVAAFARKMEALSADHRRGLFLVALVGLIPLPVATLLVPDEVLDDLEQDALIVFTVSVGAFLSVPRLLHDVIMDAMTPEMRGQLSSELDRAFSTWCPLEQSQPEERVARAIFRLDAGLEVDQGELLTLAELVHSSRPDLGARFLAQAQLVPLDVGSRLRIAALLAHQHNIDAAERVLAELDTVNLDPAAQFAITLTRAFLLAMPGQRPTEALRELDALSSERAMDATARAVRATALWRLGRIRDARALAGAIFSDDSAPAAARAQAGLTLVSASLAMGEHRRIDEWREPLLSLSTIAMHELPEGPESARLIYSAAATYTLNCVAEAEQSAAGSYRAALLGGNRVIAAQYAHAWATILVLCGRPADALVLFREALDADGVWSRVIRPWVISETIGAMLSLGDIAGGETLARELREADAAPLYDADIAMVEARLLAAHGNFAGADAVVLAHVARARVVGTGGAMSTARLLHCAVRWGSRAAATQLAGVRMNSIPGSGVPLLIDHAAALRDQDPVALMHVADELERRDLIPFAIDASAQAIQFLCATTDRETGAAAWGMLARLAGTHPSLRSSAVAQLATEIFTGRERQACALAAEGRSDSEIAARLGISTRTAQTHLSRAFAALAITSRRQLPSRLAALGLSAGTARGGNR